MKQQNQENEYQQLSPEDRQRIYEEEKAKEEAVARLKREAIEKVKAKYIPPVGTCEVPIFETQDRAILYKLAKKVDKLIFMGATITAQELQYLASCTGDIACLEVIADKPQLDELAIFTMQKGFDYLHIKDLLLALKDDQKILIFEPTIEQAENTYTKLKKAGFSCCLHSGKDVEMSTKTIETEIPRIIITWSLGCLGQAINRPMDFLCIINGEIFLPLIAHSPNCKMTAETIQAGYQAKTTNTIQQNGGRILRGDGRKVILIHSIGGSLPDMDAIKREWQPMIKEPIQTLAMESDSQYCSNALVEYLKTGKLLQQTELQFAQENLAKRPKEQLSHSQRENYSEDKRNEVKTTEKFNELAIKVVRLAREGITWNEVYHIEHFERLGKVDQRKLKKIYDTKQSSE